jgi:cation diffusion facilitator family transporter
VETKGQQTENVEKLYKEGLRLEYFTIGYNIVEAALSILFGRIAGSIALVGFGLDSIVESLSGFVLIWRLRMHGKVSEEEEEKVEHRAMLFVALTFFILGAYVLYQSVRKLVSREIADPSSAGILIAVVSIIVMPLLTLRKLKVGHAIGSEALVADAKETMACAFLSVALLMGLGLNYLFGLWQADAVTGIVIAVFLFREGWEIWNEEGD